MSFGKCLFAVLSLIAPVWVHAATPLPRLDVTVTKLLGSTRQEEIMLNRIVPYAGAHLGGVHIDTSHTPNRFYIFDAGNNRILGYRCFKPVTLPSGPFPPPDIVIGQPALWDAGAANGDNINFMPPTAATLALLPFPYVNSTMEAPRTGMMATDANGNFYVVDLCNNRVLKYIDPFETDQIADDVWGQSDFTSRARGLSASRLRTDWNYGTTIGTFGAAVDVEPDGTLWVADSGNSRVLRFPGGAKTADLVLGQNSFGTDYSGTGLNQMYKPTGVRRHPVTGELYVLDGQMDGGKLCRMLVFDPPFSTGMSADRQFGRKLGDEASGLSWSRGFAFDPGETNIVWVLDGDHCRVVKFDSYTGAMLDVIGVKTTNDTQKWHGTYERYNGTLGGIRQPDGDCGFDSQTNFYFTSLYGESPIIRIPMPLEKSAVGWVKSDGEMMKDGMNQITGRTFNDFYGLSRAGEQLYASDGNRVLVWTNQRAAVTFQQADFVIGQDSFDSQNYGAISRAGCQCTGSNFLFIAGNWNHYVYIYEMPVTNGGLYFYPMKTLKSSNNVRWDDDGTTLPFKANGLAYDAVSNCLWISDYDRNRVLRVRDPLGDARVDMVLGQTNKSGADRNHGLGLWTTDAYGFGAPWSLALDNFRNLYVVDCGFEGRVDNSGNMRVTRFDAASINPDPTNIFPFPAATGVFCKPTLTTSRSWYDSHRPHIPTFIAFNESNNMYMCCGSYGNEQGERVFFYPTPHVGLAPQPTHVIDTYFGQAATVLCDGDAVIFQDHTWNRILFHTPSSIAPSIDITNPISTVYGVATTAMGGTANSNVVGTVAWENAQGGTGAVAATAYWAISDIPLAMGPNLITVAATNQHGTVASDTVTITRDYALPFVDITNANDSVDFSVTTYSIGGTNSPCTVGVMWWENSSTSGVAGTIAAAESWTVTNIALTHGSNIIAVYGSNLVGRVMFDTVTIEVVPEAVLLPALVICALAALARARK